MLSYWKAGSSAIELAFSRTMDTYRWATS